MITINKFNQIFSFIDDHDSRTIVEEVFDDNYKIIQNNIKSVKFH